MGKSRNLATARRFYLTGDMTNLYPSIQDLLKRLFSVLFSSDIAVESIQTCCIYHCLVENFNHVVRKLILIVTEISNETANELTMYAILCRNVSVFY